MMQQARKHVNRLNSLPARNRTHPGSNLALAGHHAVGNDLPIK